jgi:hypothetical protein
MTDTPAKEIVATLHRHFCPQDPDLEQLRLASRCATS